MPQRSPRHLLAVVAAALLVAPVAACGSDDSSTPAAGSADAATSENNGAAGGTDAASDEETEQLLADALGGEGGGSFGLSLEDRLPAIETLNPDNIEIVDETTLRLTFTSGTIDINGLTSCFAAGAVMEPNETLIVVYPDGEKVCD